MRILKSSLRYFNGFKGVLWFSLKYPAFYGLYLVTHVSCFRINEQVWGFYGKFIVFEQISIV